MKIKKNVRLYIGDVYADREAAIIETVLGSCVAVCLFDPIYQVGGMNHIFLPEKLDIKYFDDNTRYGINAMEILINKIMNMGGKRKNIVAKVFGGSSLFPSIFEEDGVGAKNVKFVLKFLEQERIKIITKDVKGYDTRKIYFHTDTGDVFLRRFSSKNYSKIAVKEKQYLRKIKKEINKPGKITLFE